MKKILYICLTTLLFASQACENKEDDVFDKSPDERIQEKITKYQELLRSAEYGWDIDVIPGDTTMGFYNFHMNFTGADKVYLSGDQDFRDFESSLDSALYDVKSTQEMTLVFTTFSQFNFFSNPNLSAGRGFGGDIELLFKQVSDDTIKFEGKTKKGTYIFRRSKVPAEYIDTLSEIRLQELYLLETFTDQPDKFGAIVLESGEKISFTLNWNRSCFISYFDEEKNSLIEHFDRVNFKTNGFELSKGFNYKGDRIKTFSCNNETEVFSISGSKLKGEIQMSVYPTVKSLTNADDFLDVAFAPLIKTSSKLKTLLQNLTYVDIDYEYSLYATIHFFNTEDFAGIGFKMTKKTNLKESSYLGVPYQDNKIEKLDTDKIRFTSISKELLAEPVQELLNSDEGKAVCEHLYNEKGFVIIKGQERDEVDKSMIRTYFKLLSMNDPDIWFKVYDLSN